VPGASRAAAHVAAKLGQEHPERRQGAPSLLLTLARDEQIVSVAFDTRIGSLLLPFPKLRQGSYYPEWLFARRRRAERALVAVICDGYGRGVSTRRVDGLVKALGRGASRKARSRRWPRLSTPKWPPFAPARLTAAPTPTCGWTPSQ